MTSLTGRKIPPITGDIHPIMVPIRPLFVWYGDTHGDIGLVSYSKLTLKNDKS